MAPPFFHAWDPTGAPRLVRGTARTQSLRAFLRGIRVLGKAAVSQWIEDRAPRLGAALAFYTFFSLAPTLVISVSVVGMVLGRDAARYEVIGQIRGLVGDESAEAIAGMLESAGKPGASIPASIGGALAILVGATGAFVELQDSLNLIWRSPKRHAGIMAAIRSRILSFAMLLGVSFLLLVSLVVSAATSAAADVLCRCISDGAMLLLVANLILSLGVVTALFAMIFKILPDAPVRWRDVWLGAALTAALFTIGKFFIGFYLGRTVTSSVYGAAWTLAVVLLWTYYSAQILFFGAELTEVHSRYAGRKLRDRPVFPSP